MDKLKMHSPDFTEQNTDRLMKLFPNCVTESVGDDGQCKRVVDFDQLRQELAGSIVDGPRERFHLEWPGKKSALLAANSPIAKTLRPCPDESVAFETTKNLFIEGDNLDALKLLQETYLNQVKMIYIDPPYNTGNDFVYDDNFSETSAAYFERSQQRDSASNRMVANNESNGRFHSDWLSMIYPRLRLARNLLSDSGLIFVSIDDGEVANLRCIMDEVFGADNFLACVAWEKRYTRSNNAKLFYSLKDNILVYRKSAEVSLLREPRSEESKDIYKNPDGDPRGIWTSSSYVNPATKEMRPNLVYSIVNPATGITVDHPTHAWKYEQAEHKRHVEEGRLWWGKDGNAKFPRLKNFLSEMRDGVVPIDLWFYKLSGTTDEGGAEVKELFGSAVFDNPKPTRLIERMLGLLPNPDAGDIIMDFFCGSASTAHAVMKTNAEDGGHRRYIMVQLPEVCDEKNVAYQAGFKTVAEISKERIRLAGKKLKAEYAATAPHLDIGFRVLKVDTSNMKDVYYAPDGIKQGDLLEQIENIKENRTAEDLLFQVLLDWGVDPSLPIAAEAIEGKTVFFVAECALAACFDNDINEQLVKKLAARKPLRAVFRDAGYGKDTVKINVEQIFKLISPNTEVKSI